MKLETLNIGAVMEFFIGLLGAGFLVSMILCGLYLIMRWDDGSDAMDAKARGYAEERKNARIAAELKATREGVDE